VLLLEPPTSAPFEDLDWLDEQYRHLRPVSDGGALPMYPALTPLALSFRRGAPARPGPVELTWLMRGMAAVLATAPPSPAAEAIIDASALAEAASAADSVDVASPTQIKGVGTSGDQAALAAAARCLRPTVSPASLPFADNSLRQRWGGGGGGSAAPEPWFTSCGERGSGLEALVDPMLLPLAERS